MRNMCVGLTAIVVSVGALTVAAQGRNFSGTWVIDSEKTMAAMSASGGVGGGMISAGGGGAVMARGGGGGRGGVVSASGGGTMTAAAGGGAATGSATAGATGGVISARGTGGGRGGVIVGNSDTVISLDGSSFSLEAGGAKTAYPLNGTEVPVEVRGIGGHGRAVWEGDTLVITTTLDSPNGPVTSVARWSMEGDSLVRETARKTYYKRK